jgi:hypothetical protein
LKKIGLTHCRRLQAAHGVQAPLRRSPNKPPALPEVI